MYYTIALPSSGDSFLQKGRETKGEEIERKKHPKRETVKMSYNLSYECHHNLLHSSLFPLRVKSGQFFVFAFNNSSFVLEIQREREREEDRVKKVGKERKRERERKGKKEE